MERGRRTVSLHVDAKVLGRSIHASLACTDCHETFDPASLPHRPKITPVNCTTCHGDPAEHHRFHPFLTVEAAVEGRPGASCTGCHGTHDVTSPKSTDSRLHASRLAQACAECHATVTRIYVASAHGSALAEGQEGAPGCLACHGREGIVAVPGSDSAQVKTAQEKLCLSCHLDDPAVRSRTAPRAGFIAAYERSVHGAALLAGRGQAANCVDCHGSHEMRKGFDPASRVAKANVPETCGRCHAGVAAQYATSIHAAGVRRGNLDAPVCTDCHGEHTIRLHDDPRSPVAPANVAGQVCSPCHSSLRLAEKYEIPTGRTKSFEDSFHGLAIRGGSVEVANCASCHGSHDIKPSSDPTSRVHKDSLAGTCGRCHPGANQRFAMGTVHLVVEPGGQPLLWWIGGIYVGLIVVVIGGMLVHNLLDFAWRLRRRLREEAGEGPRGGEAWHLRMTLGERLQHWALLLSFGALALTGFMLHYPEAWWVRSLRGLSQNLFEWRSDIHRIAGVLMVAASLVHLGYLVLTERGREFWKDMRPARSDLLDLARALAWSTGLSRRKPLFGRFGYVEKSEYWAVIWGVAIMTVTGVVMWFENIFISIFTKLGWDVARTIHFYEAVLATLAILVWHLYHVVFKPDVYPTNPAWITGYVPESLLAEEHPLELEEIRRHQGEERRAVEGPVPEGSPADATPGGAAPASANTPGGEPIPKSE